MILWFSSRSAFPERRLQSREFFLTGCKFEEAWFFQLLTVYMYSKSHSGMGRFLELLHYLTLLGLGRTFRAISLGRFATVHSGLSVLYALYELWTWCLKRILNKFCAKLFLNLYNDGSQTYQYRYISLVGNWSANTVRSSHIVSTALVLVVVGSVLLSILYTYKKQ